ncbi:MAG: hypothetical protein RBR67_17840 [Desulfobacterium sp.]|nr:hypothetical protein [Desulfobacterium sp.]
MTATEKFNEIFGRQRDTRSPEYKAGVMAWLQHKFEKKEIQVPYKAGTCQFDAFFAGMDEGKSYPIN